MFAFTDMAGDHFWTGKDWICIEDAVDYDGAMPCCATREAANRVVRRQRKKQCALRAVRVSDTFLVTAECGMFAESPGKLAAMLCAMVRRAGGRSRMPLEELETILIGYDLRISTHPREKVFELRVERVQSIYAEPTPSRN
jgi:hypothetical protein